MKTSPPDLTILRKRIDTIDAQIIALLGERFALLADVVAVKAAQDMQTYDPDREVALLKRLTQRAQEEGIDPSFVQALFMQILTESRRMQNTIISTKDL